MEIKVIGENTLGLGRLCIEMMHGEQKIQWDIGGFDRSNFQEVDVFEHINKYWSSKTLEQQNNVFNKYLKIKQVFDSTWEADQLTKDLFVLIDDLMQLHNLDEIEQWVNLKTNIYFPSELEDTYNDSPDKAGSREQTYLKNDYVKLVVLSLTLRVMIPIWGEYIARTRRHVGTVFKEYYAYKLLTKSSIMHCEAIEKLKTYIDHTAPPDKTMATAIVGGISTEDFSYWILSLVVVRRLCVGDIRGIDPKNTLIKFIYKYILQKVRGNENNFAGIIKEKRFEDSGTSDDSNLSKLEGYKIRHELPPGDVVALEYAVSDPFKVAKMLAPNIDLDLVSTALKTSLVLQSNTIVEPQLFLLQWIFKPVVSPRAILYLSKNTVVTCLAVAQAVLWHREHFTLAGIVTSRIHQGGDGVMVTTVDSRARVPKEMQEQLITYYPHAKKQGSKNRPKIVNQVLESIDNLTNNLASYDWYLTLEQSQVIKSNTGINSRRLTIPHDIKIQIAKLVLELAQRNWKK